MIELKGITKTYQLGKEDVHVLINVNVSIENGEFVAIMGPSGSGKSTLMNIIGCLDQATTGEYWLSGQNISGYSEDELARVRNTSIGFVFQQFQLLPRLVAWKNVELPMIYAGVSKKERQFRSEEALKKVGLEDRMSHLPNALSGGKNSVLLLHALLSHNPN